MDLKMVSKMDLETFAIKLLANNDFVLPYHVFDRFCVRSEAENWCPRDHFGVPNAIRCTR